MTLSDTPRKEPSGALAPNNTPDQEDLVRLRKAVEASGEVMFLTDRDGLITYVNPAFVALYGYSPDEVVGKVTPRILKSGRTSDANLALFWKTILSNQVVKGELVNKTKDGRLITIDGSANPILDTNGAIIGFLAIQRDITERKVAEQALAAAEKKYRDLAENAGDILLLMDLEGRITYASRSGEYTGYTREELQTKHIQELLSPASLKTARERIQAWSSGVKSLPPFEVEVIARDGKVVPFELSTSRVMTGDKVRAIQVIARNIVERKRQLQAVQDSQNKYRNLVEKLQEGIYQADIEGNLLTLNQAGARIFGFDCPQDVIGKRLTSEFYVNPEDRKQVIDGVRNRGAFSGEYPIRRVDGSIGWLRLNSTAIRDATGNVIGSEGVMADVTDQRRAEQALRESERHYRLLADNVSDVILTTDLKFRITYASPSITTMLGYSVEEAKSLAARELLTADSFETASKSLLESLNRQQSASAGVSSPPQAQLFDMEMRRKGGDTIWVEFRGVLLHDDAGRPSGVLGVTRDITDRKRAQDAMAASERKYRTLVENANDFIYLLDTQGKVLSINEAGARVMGKRPADVEGLSLSDIFPPEPAAIFIRAVERIASTGQSVQSDDVKDVLGKGTWLTSRLSPVKNELGQVTAVLGLSRDITRQKQAEERLRASEEKYRTLVENSPDFIFLLDQQGNVISLNRAAAGILGEEPSGVEGKNLRDIFLPETAAQFLNSAKQVFLTGRELVGESNFGKIRADMWITTRLSPVLDDKGKVAAVLGVARDISESKRAEDRLRESEERFRTLFETMAQGALYQDGEGRIIAVNPAAERITGLWLSGLAGRNPVEMKWRALDGDGRDILLDEYPYAIALRTGYPVLNFTMGAFNPVTRRHVWMIVNATPQFRPGEKRPYQVFTTFSDITERKLAEDHSKLLAQLLDAQLDPIFVHDFEGNFTFVNQAACTSHGYTREEMLALKLGDVDSPASATLIQERLHELAENGQATFEASHFHKDGRLLPFEVHTQVTEWQGKNVILSVARDISERKRAQEALAQAEQNFRRTLEDSPMAMRIVTDDEDTLYANKAFLELYQYRSIEEANAVPVKLRYTPASYAEHLRRREMRALGKPIPTAYQIEAVRHDGEARFLDVMRREVTWNGYPRHLVIYSDITERKKTEDAQKALAAEKTRLFGLVENAKKEWETTFDAMSDGVALLGLDFRIVRANKGLASLLGSSPKDLVGKFCHDAICGREKPETDCPSLRCIQDKHSCQIDRQEAHLGNKWLHVSVDPLFGPTGDLNGLTYVVRDITAQKRAEDAIRYSEERFRTVFQASPVGLIISTSDGRILRSNETAQRILGYTARELEALTNEDITVPEDMAIGMSRLAELRDGKRDSFQREKRYVARDGHVVWANVRVHAIRDRNGQQLYNVVLFEDITERREIDAQRAATSGLLELFTKEPAQSAYLEAAVKLIKEWSGCSAAGVRLVNKQGELPYQACLGFGPQFYESEASLSMKKDRCICIRMVSGSPEPQDAPYLTTSGSFCCENISGFLAALPPRVRSQYRDGCFNAGYASLAIVPIRYGNETLGMVQLADTREGIISRKAVGYLESMALLLGEAIHRFNVEQQVQYNQDAQAVTNSMLRVSLENSPLQEIMEHTLRLVTSVSWLGFQPKGAIFLAEKDPGYLEMKAQLGLEESRLFCSRVMFGKCLCGRAAATAQVQFSDRIDERHENCRELAAQHGHYCIPILSAGKVLGVMAVYLREGHLRDYREELFLCTVADVLAGIIEQRRAQTKVIEFQELNKLKTSLLATVSHELRTPLATIKGYSTMIIDYDRRLKRDEKLEYLRSVDKAADRLTELVDHLLDMSRLEAGLFRLDRRMVNIEQVVLEAAADTRLRSPEHFIKTSIANGLPQARVDSKRVRQVIDNLLDNAIKYSEAGTEIVVRAQMKDGNIEVSVTDHGRGIPADETDKIFDRFYRIEQRLSKDPGGMGLGLSLCKALVEAHGGSIKVDSTPGKGSTFYFTLAVTGS